MNPSPDLQKQVQDVLQEDHHLRGYGIEVLDSNGVITLRGTVPSAEVRDQAEALVRRVEGVKGVINELDVV